MLLFSGHVSDTDSFRSSHGMVRSASFFETACPKFHHVFHSESKDLQRQLSDLPRPRLPLKCTGFSQQPGLQIQSSAQSAYCIFAQWHRTLWKCGTTFHSLRHRASLPAPDGNAECSAYSAHFVLQTSPAPLAPAELEYPGAFPQNLRALSHFPQDSSLSAL